MGTFQISGHLNPCSKSCACAGRTMEGIMARITPLIAAATLTISWATPAGAATLEKDNAAALSTTAATATAAQKSPNSSQCKKDKGLFDRLGGFFGIAAVVDNFSDAILVNPVLNQNPALA